MSVYCFQRTQHKPAPHSQRPPQDSSGGSLSKKHPGDHHTPQRPNDLKRPVDGGGSSHLGPGGKIPRMDRTYSGSSAHSGGRHSGSGDGYDPRRSSFSHSERAGGSTKDRSRDGYVRVSLIPCLQCGLKKKNTPEMFVIISCLNYRKSALAERTEPRMFNWLLRKNYHLSATITQSGRQHMDFLLSKFEEDQKRCYRHFQLKRNPLLANKLKAISTRQKFMLRIFLTTTNWKLNSLSFKSIGQKMRGPPKKSILLVVKCFINLLSWRCRMRFDFGD